MQLLISHGADVNLRGGCDGWTPIFYAAMAGHSILVEFLLEVGASTEVGSVWLGGRGGGGIQAWTF